MSYRNMNKEDVLAWLEKQGEQKTEHQQIVKNLQDNSFRRMFERKSVWSEEDEYYRNIILYILNNECVGKTDKENAINWLKSIRPQSTWKPSEEQMKALQEAIIEMGKSVSPCSIEEFHEIQSLYCNLKKLTE